MQCHEEVDPDQGGEPGASASCERSESGVLRAGLPLQTFTVQGFLRGINFADKSVTVEHEEIPDYMPSMTMPFDVKIMAEVERWGIFSGVLALLFVPALFGEGSPAALLQLYFNTLGLAAIFGSLGLCAGIFAHDLVQALVLGLSAWLFLLFGLDLIALLFAQWEPLQKAPDLWVGVLMANPLDAFRIQALFAMEQIPAEAANKTPLAAWWLANASLWFAIVSALWSAALLCLTVRRLERAEI